MTEAMTDRVGPSAGGGRALEPAPGIVIDGDLRAQWKSIVAMQRADRRNVVVLAVGSRRRSEARAKGRSPRRITSSV